MLRLCTYKGISIFKSMKNKQRVSKSQKRKGGSPAAGRRKSQRKSLSLNASPVSSSRGSVSIGDVMEFYKPIKKPITLRLDADVLAWFRRDGRRYQTRINAALRRIMEREMKELG